MRGSVQSSANPHNGHFEILTFESTQYCPTFGKRNLVTYHLNLSYWCFYILPSVLFFQAKFYASTLILLRDMLVRHHEIPLTSVQGTDIFCSFTRNVTFVNCFRFAKVGQNNVQVNYRNKRTYAISPTYWLNLMMTFEQVVD